MDAPERLVGGAGLSDNLDAVRLEQLPQASADDLMVVEKEDRDRLVAHGARVRRPRRRPSA